MMNDFQKEIQQSLRKFCQTKIDPFVEEDDHEEKFRLEVYQEIGKLGFAGGPIGEQWGGSELSCEDFCLVLGEIARSSVSYAVTLSVSTMVQGVIEKFGTDEQKSTYLPKLTSGEEIAAFALSESSAGSDAASLKTTARESDGGYILNGSKMWITSGGIAKTYLVMARTGGEGSKGISAFIVRDGTPGFEYGKKERKMGWKVSPTRELIFNDCFVPKENMLGQKGEGLKVALSTLDKGRITIGAISVGLSKRALDEAVKYSLYRQQFNQPIFDFQGLQFMMSDMATEIAAAECLVEKAAKLYDQSTPDPKLSSMAKLKASDTAMKVTTDAVQILGGVGYTSEYPVERLMRDAKVLQIVEGTNQIQKVVIARHLRKEYE